MTYITAGLMVTMVAIAVYTDVRVGKIFNWLTAPCALLGLILNTVYGGWDGLQLSLAGIGVGFGVFIFSLLFGRLLGGGDIKLLIAVGAITGPIFLLWTLVYMALCGGVLAVVVAMWRGDLIASLKRLTSGLWMRMVAKVPLDIADAKPKARLPYAIPIALGSVITLVITSLQGF